MKNPRPWLGLLVAIPIAGTSGCGLICPEPWFFLVTVASEDNADLGLTPSDTGFDLPVLHLEAVNTAGNEGVVEWQFEFDEGDGLSLPDQMHNKISCDNESVCQPDEFVLHFDLLWSDGSLVDAEDFPTRSQGCDEPDAELWKGWAVSISCFADLESVPCP